jgi:hypothetical protein
VVAPHLRPAPPLYPGLKCEYFDFLPAAGPIPAEYVSIGEIEIFWDADAEWDQCQVPEVQHPWERLVSKEHRVWADWRVFGPEEVRAPAVAADFVAQAEKLAARCDQPGEWAPPQGDSAFAPVCPDRLGTYVRARNRADVTPEKGEIQCEYSPLRASGVPNHVSLTTVWKTAQPCTLLSVRISANADAAGLSSAAKEQVERDYQAKLPPIPRCVYTPTEQAATVTDDDENSSNVLLLAIIAIVVIGGGIGLWYISRRRKVAAGSE